MSYIINHDNGTPKRKVDTEIVFVPIEHFPQCKICRRRFANVDALSIHLFCGCSSETPERKFGVLNLPTPKTKPPRAPVALDLIEAEDMLGEAVARFDPFPDPDDDQDRLEAEGGGIEYQGGLV